MSKSPYTISCAVAGDAAGGDALPRPSPTLAGGGDLLMVRRFAFSPVSADAGGEGGGGCDGGGEGRAGGRIIPVIGSHSSLPTTMA